MLEHAELLLRRLEPRDDRRLGRRLRVVLLLEAAEAARALLDQHRPPAEDGPRPRQRRQRALKGRQDVRAARGGELRLAARPRELIVAAGRADASARRRRAARRRRLHPVMRQAPQRAVVLRRERRLRGRAAVRAAVLGGQRRRVRRRRARHVELHAAAVAVVCHGKEASPSAGSRTAATPTTLGGSSAAAAADAATAAAAAAVGDNGAARGRRGRVRFWRRLRRDAVLVGRLEEERPLVRPRQLNRREAARRGVGEDARRGEAVHAQWSHWSGGGGADAAAPPAADDDAPPPPPQSTR